ncbi:hypothetical protein SEA_RUTHERFERD_44 [Mycobacterium phage Rutherferd]|nr:hypothetical protein SEA_RUTHERFERD_44 [Mycobacterium phage Rutherferd]
MSKHEYSIHHPTRMIHSQIRLAARLNLLRRGFSDEGRHRLPEVRFSQELPDAAVYWSPNRKAFFRRDDSLPSGWVQRIYPRVATSFRTGE